MSAGDGVDVDGPVSGGPAPDWAWLDGLRTALAALPYPVAAPGGDWDELFLSDSTQVAGAVWDVAVTGARGELWVEVHSAEPGALAVADRLAEHGGTEAEAVRGSAVVEVDGRPVPALSWTLPERAGDDTGSGDGEPQEACTVLLVEEAHVVRTVTVTGGEVPAGLELITVTDVAPLLDAYARVAGWSRP